MEIRPLKAIDDLNLIGEIYVQSWKYAYREIISEEFLVRLTSERWVTVLKDNPFSKLCAAVARKGDGHSSCSSARDEILLGWGELISLYLLPECT